MELDLIKNKHKDVLYKRSHYTGNVKNDCEILVHCNTGHKDHEKELIENINNALNKHGLKAKVIKTGCFAAFFVGTVITMYPSGVIYTNVENADIEKLLITHFTQKQVYTPALHKNENKVCTTKKDFDFFGRQQIVVGRNVGFIDSTNIEEYIASGGYYAAHNVIFDKSSDFVINELKTSGLRGRGGAGFPTHLKWQFALTQKSKTKYVVCNADEGDPGAFMNRALLEGDPHSIIEGMIIAAKTIGAHKGFIYIREEYPLANKMLKNAIEQARKLHLLGKNIFESSFDFDIEIKQGAGAYVCGEENALINSIEGSRGESKPKPPFPTTSGLFGKPTIINNVETLSIIPQIIKNGGKWYAKMGVPKSRGTKVFALSGDINKTGIVEVELGTTINKIINTIGGGVPNGKKLKFIQLGGPSGGCIPESLMDIQVDYESLSNYGAIMGSGSLIAVDNTTCVVDFSKFFVKFNNEESCGKCTPCRIGNERVLELLTKISKMQGTEEDIKTLKDLCTHITTNSLCGLGQTSTNIVKSTLHHFEKEYMQHINNKMCRTKQCHKNFVLEITDECTKCGICFKSCPKNTIIEEETKFTILQPDCIKCMRCLKDCSHNAIVTK